MHWLCVRKTLYGAIFNGDIEKAKPYRNMLLVRCVCVCVYCTVCAHSNSLSNPLILCLQKLTSGFTQPMDIQWPLLLWYRVVIFALNINSVLRSPCWGVKCLSVMWAWFRCQGRSRKRTMEPDPLVKSWDKNGFVSFCFSLLLLWFCWRWMKIK